VIEESGATGAAPAITGILIRSITVRATILNRVIYSKNHQPVDYYYTRV
jgi:hypothetical protein